MAYASSAIKRLASEQRSMMKQENRVCDFYAAPLESNIFEWHFTIRGPQDANLPYAKGLYHGALVFSRAYPFEPPDIIFFTNNGRFELHTKICSTISSFHKEMWQPSYDIPFTLTALRLFMGQESEIGIGAISKGNVSKAEKEKLAEQSWNYTCQGCGCKVRELWETQMKMYPETSPEKEAAVPAPPPSNSSDTATGATAEEAEAAAAKTEGEKGEGEAATPSAATPQASPTTAPTPSPGERPGGAQGNRVHSEGKEEAQGAVDSPNDNHSNSSSPHTAPATTTSAASPSVESGKGVAGGKLTSPASTAAAQPMPAASSPSQPAAAVTNSPTRVPGTVSPVAMPSPAVHPVPPPPPAQNVRSPTTTSAAQVDETIRSPVGPSNPAGAVASPTTATAAAGAAGPTMLRIRVASFTLRIPLRQLDQFILVCAATAGAIVLRRFVAYLVFSSSFLPQSFG